MVSLAWFRALTPFSREARSSLSRKSRLPLHCYFRSGSWRPDIVSSYFFFLNYPVIVATVHTIQRFMLSTQITFTSSVPRPRWDATVCRRLFQNIFSLVQSSNASHASPSQGAAAFSVGRGVYLAALSSYGGTLQSSSSTSMKTWQRNVSVTVG